MTVDHDKKIKLQNIINSFSYIFEDDPPRLNSKSSMNGTLFLMNTDQVLLKKSFGKVEIMFTFKNADKLIKLTKYKLLFTHLKCKISVEESNKKTESEPFGYRMEYDSAVDSFDHPPLHIQLSFAEKPRIIHLYSNEEDALRDFLSTIKINFFKNKNDKEKQNFIFSDCNLVMRK